MKPRLFVRRRRRISIWSAAIYRRFSWRSKTALRPSITAHFTRQSGDKSPHSKVKKGVALVVVLIGLAVTTTIFLSVLKLIAVQRQSVELQTRQIQAGWLAESAVERAVARLSAEADYRGETWNISAQDLGGRDAATIKIHVDDVPGKPDRRTVRVEADYPDNPDLRAARNVK